VLVRHQKETRSVASGPAFYRLLPPKRQGIAVSVQQRSSVSSVNRGLGRWRPCEVRPQLSDAIVRGHVGLRALVQPAKAGHIPANSPFAEANSDAEHG